jgi:hypothetical protein
VIYNDSGARVQKASNAGKVTKADGFVLAAVSMGATATVYGPGQVNDQLSGLTIGETYYLGTGGAVTATIPAAADDVVVQTIGVAHSTTAIRFVGQPIIVRAL